MSKLLGIADSVGVADRIADTVVIGDVSHPNITVTVDDTELHAGGWMQLTPERVDARAYCQQF